MVATLPFMMSVLRCAHVACCYDGEMVWLSYMPLERANAGHAAQSEQSAAPLPAIVPDWPTQ